MKGNDLRYGRERRTQRILEGAIRQKIAQEKQAKKYNGEAFAQPGDIRLHNDDGDMFSKYTGFVLCHKRIC